MAGLALAGSVSVGAGPAAGSVAVVRQESGELQLVSANSLVAADGTFSARVSLGSLASDPDLRVGVTVYTVLDDERGLDRTPRLPINQLPARPLDELPVDADGVVTVDVPIRGGEPFDDIDRILIPGPGIYPVVIELRDRQGMVASLRLDLIRLPATPTAPPAGDEVATRRLALAVPVGQHGLSVTEATELLRRHRSVPLTVILGPGVLARLPAEGAAVEDFVSAVGSRPVVSVVQPDLDPSALAAIGQGDLYRQAVASTADAVARLGFVADRSIVATTTPLTAAGADLVVRAGGSVAIELGTRTAAARAGADDDAGDDSDSAPPSAGLIPTPSGPLAVVSLDSGGPTDELDATSTTPTSTTPNSTTPNSNAAGDGAGDRGGPVGVAHHELAHLMSRSPGGPPRLLGGFGPLDRVQPDAFGDPDVLDVLFTVLSETGAASTSTGEPSNRPFTLLGLVEAARDRARVELAPAPAPATDLEPAADSVATVQDLLSTYDGFYADGRDSPADLRARMARALAVDQTASERKLELAQIARLLGDELISFSLPTDQSVTLAARRASIPLTIENGTSGRRNVLLSFRSANVAVTENNRLIEVEPGTSSIDVEVEARALGESPLVVTVRTPDGRHVLSSTRFRVRSTAVPGLGLAISAAGLVGLAIWWYVSIKRNRANGRRRRPRWGGGPDPGGPGPDDHGGGGAAMGTVVALPVDRSGRSEVDRTATLVGDSVVP
ncbi:MAG: hypothetical protein R2761_10200 [Acidimicrobiales bacterium]